MPGQLKTDGSVLMDYSKKRHSLQCSMRGLALGSEGKDWFGAWKQTDFLKI